MPERLAVCCRAHRPWRGGWIWRCRRCGRHSSRGARLLRSGCSVLERSGVCTLSARAVVRGDKAGAQSAELDCCEHEHQDEEQASPEHRVARAASTVSLHLAA
eukprot:4367525-Prymnesium_polylepis.1